MPPENLFNYSSLEEIKKNSKLAEDLPDKYGKHIDSFIYGIEKEPVWWKPLLESTKLSKTETGELYLFIDKDTQAPLFFKKGDIIQKIGVSIHHYLSPFTHD